MQFLEVVRFYCFVGHVGGLSVRLDAAMVCWWRSAVSDKEMGLRR